MSESDKVAIAVAAERSLRTVSNKQLLGIAGSVIFILISVGAPSIYWLAALNESVKTLSGQMESVNSKLETIVINDVAQIKTRLTVMESKGILPEADDRLDKLEERVRHLEQRNN